MPASFFKGFRSEVSFSYTKTSLFTFSSSSQQDNFSGKLFTLHVRVSNITNYCRKTKGTLSLPQFLFAYKSLLLLHKAKVMVWLRWGERGWSVQIHVEAVWYNFPPQVLVGNVHISLTEAQTFLQPMLQACLPSLSHPLKPSCSSPQRCPLSLAGSHSS